MESINEMKKDFGTILVPLQWKTMLESGIEVEVVNNNFNPRQILSDYILTINSEIDRKREEFGLASSKKDADPTK